jgi:hypothetical protein
MVWNFTENASGENGSLGTHCTKRDNGNRMSLESGSFVAVESCLDEATLVVLFMQIPKEA